MMERVADHIAKVETEAFRACWPAAPMVAAAALIPALPAAAQPAPAGLFSAVGSARAETVEPPPFAGGDALILRQRLVTVDVGMLVAARRSITRSATPAPALNLNLFDDVVFSAIIDRTAPSRLGYALSGRLAGIEPSRTTFVVNGSLVVGTIETPGAAYRIRPAASGTHVIHQIDRSRLPPEAHPAAPPDAERAAPGPALYAGTDAPRDTLGADDGSTIDVIVFYTPAARAGQGGHVAIEMLIDQFVDETNQAYQHSGVIQRVNLVHAQEIEHTEGTYFQDAELERRDEVLALRDVYAADVVHFVIETPNDYCGIASFMSYVSPDFESSAFGYTDYRCGGMTFAHELGHNMGLNHDRYAERSDLSNEPYPYSYGYVNQRMFERNAPESSRWRTLMSYSDQCSDAGISCMKLLRFSNPDMAYGGDLMGVSGDSASMEIAGPSDARRTLNETRTTVANFRRSSDRTDRCIYVTTPGRQFVEWGGGRFSIAVTTRPGCSWTATSNAEFVTVTHGGSGAGPGTVEYRVAANTGSPRVGMLTVAGRPFGVEQVGPVNQGVCDRTPLVRDALVDAVATVNYCWDMLASYLSGIRRLQLAGQGPQRLSELRAADFFGLTGLTHLLVVNHNLTTLPAGLFSGLTALRGLWLVDNGMLTTLPPRLFSDLANLERLYLYGNALTDLPADAFAGLSGVEQLGLNSNRLETLPADVFDGLSGLKDLGLEDNNLKTLPAGIFSDLPRLEVLTLQRNEFAALPAGIFAGLYGLQGFFLTGNPGSPFPLTLELAGTDGGVVVGLAEGAPFDMAVGLSVTGGTLSTNVARLSTGRLFSDVVSVIPHENAAATIVSLGPPPPIPVGTCTRIVPCYSGVRMEVGGPLTLARRNRAPEAVGTLGPVTIKVGEAAVIVEVGGAFRDPDGDALSYTASSSAPQVATARAVNTRVTVTGVGEGTAAIRVTATDPGGLSAAQSFGLRVAAPFTDDPIRPGVTPIRAVHFTELRTRIDALRVAAGLGRFRWTDPVLRAGVTQVRLAHLLELRDALSSGYAAAGRPPPRWSDTAPAGGATAIRAAHVTELRAAVVALE